MRYVMVEPRAQALRDFAFDTKQGIERESLGYGRVEQREISGRMRLRCCGRHFRPAAAKSVIGTSGGGSPLQMRQVIDGRIAAEVAARCQGIEFQARNLSHR